MRRWTLVIIVVYIIVTYPVDEGLSVAFLYYCCVDICPARCLSRGKMGSCFFLSERMQSGKVI